VAALPNVVVYESAYPLEWMHNPWRDLDESGEWLLRLEATLQPDIIHLNSFGYGALPFSAPKIVVAHSDVFSWWWAVKGEAPTPDWQEYYQRVCTGLNSADMVIAPSQFMIEQIEKLYAPTTPCKVIYNCREASLFGPREKMPLVMSIGRIWDEAKNIRLLLHAASHVASGIRLAGDNAFEQNGLMDSAPNVQYLGKLRTDEVAANLAVASVYALPAKYEPFGLSVLEAALSGCALVLGNIPSLREIWQDAALFVDMEDAPGLALTINQLLADNNMLQQYASKAFERAKAFAPETMAPKYLQAYRQLITQKELIKQEIA
jgi:glycosyltransferase involved in cell wall biosynthesis